MSHVLRYLVLALFAISTQALHTPIAESAADKLRSRLAPENQPHLKRQSAPTTSSIYNTRFANTTWDNDNWLITTTALDQGHYQSRVSLANGYIGLNVAAIGPFFEVDSPVDGDDIEGWPIFNRRQTFAGLAGFYDSQPTTNGTNFPWLNQYGGESVISGIPHWGGLIPLLSSGDYLDASVDNSTISNFSSTLDFKRGVLVWSLTWSPSGLNGTSLDLVYSMFIHKLYVNNAAVQLSITPSSDINGNVIDVLDGTSAVRTDFVDKAFGPTSIFTSVRPNGINNVTAYVYSTLGYADPAGTFNASSRVLITDAPFLGANDSSIAQCVNVSLKAGTTSTITKYVGAASGDGFEDPQAIAEIASLSGQVIGYDSLLNSHISEWAVVLPEASVDDYTFSENNSLPSDPNVVELAITAVTNPFYLLENTISANALIASDNAPIDDNSISVCGLGSDCYGGQVFWDAEIWMQPGLVVAFPEAAKQIANYRVAKYPQALANAQTGFTSSKNQTGRFSNDAAAYSWTSGRYGNCTGTGPCFDYEYHINGDIAQELLNYWIVTGDTEFFETQLFPIYNSVAVFYSELLDFNSTTGEWVLTNGTDPDEYANNVDNGAYTMALIATTLSTTNTFRQMFNQTPNATFAQQAASIDIPKDAGAGIISEYSGMNGSISVKQADVVLITYPLDYTNNYTAADSLNDLDYYAGKQSQNGPGMTYAIFSIIANQVDQSGCSSYTYDLYAGQPYTRGPWFQFSEQLVDDFTANGGTHPAYPFLTGIGGDNQVTIFGFLGLRLMLDRLNIDPSLPPQIPQITYRTIYWQGWPIKASSNQTHTTITRMGSAMANANQTFANSSIPVQIAQNTTTLYPLMPNSTLVFPNRQIGNVKTVAGNIAQCLPVSSPDDYVPGQFPLSAVDGASSTKWQPAVSNVSSSITVELVSQSFQPITALQFDWGQAPPANFNVIFYNSSTSAMVPVSNSSSVAISLPYNATQSNLVTPYMSNTTNVTVNPPIYSGMYATLTIEGNQLSAFNNGTGATVAEWVIIGNGGMPVQMKYKPRRASPWS
ncbi:MAG: hypothetical protein M1827_005932 [Pycnora praestabilis]|nr:MAG: hypothetical protein M1827_005932 [Pycnora praestabilis]